MMEAGRELDREVAEKVMGWKPWASGYNKEPDCWATGKTGDDESPTVLISGWRPSEDIGAAWEVVEKIPMTIYAPGAPYADGEYRNRASGYNRVVNHLLVYDDDQPHQDDEIDLPWAAEAYWPPDAEGKSQYGLVFAETAPLAICLAALRAVGAEG